MRRKKTVDVIIPTYKPNERLLDIISKLDNQTYPINRIILMNTEEKYFNVLVLGNSYWEQKKHEVDVEHLSKMEFDHGKTRAMGVEKSKADFFICMTDDAIPADDTLVEELLKPLLSGEAAVSYAKQLPNENCRLIERYTRSYNYSDEPMLKSLNDKERMGIKTYFCSNVCAAYNRSVYEELGGFIRHTIFNEDMIYAYQVITSGKKIAYVPTAKVFHSHNFSNMEQFHRNFDLGVSQALHPEIFLDVPSTGEGKRMVKQTAKYLCEQHQKKYLPQLYMQSAFKFIGYQLGLNYRRLPESFVLKCSMSREFWLKESIMNAAKGIDPHRGCGISKEERL